MEIEIEKSLTVVEIRIKFLRKLKGLTQTELANALNITQALVNSWENGYANISLRQLVRLAYFFKVPIDYILGLTTPFDISIYDFKKELDLIFLGNKIKIIRSAEQLSQEELASKMHTKRSNISSYEIGKKMMSSVDLKEICFIFGYSADWCCGNTKECIRRDKRALISDEEITKYIEI